MAILFVQAVNSFNQKQCVGLICLEFKYEEPVPTMMSVSIIWQVQQNTCQSYDMK